MIEIDIQTTPLDPQVCLQKVEDPTVGGIVSFVGSVRNHSQGKKVLRLEFECYEKMARSEMKKIAELAVENFQVKNILIHHRVGTLAIGGNCRCSSCSFGPSKKCFRSLSVCHQ